APPRRVRRARARAPPRRERAVPGGGFGGTWVLAPRIGRGQTQVEDFVCRWLLLKDFIRLRKTFDRASRRHRIDPENLMRESKHSVKGTASPMAARGRATIAVLHPGEMGARLGAILVGRGHRVLAWSAGRSDATRCRAAAAGIEEAASLAELA